MRCYICDRDDSLIYYDKVEQAYSPCTTCQAAIDESLLDFEEVEEEEPL